MVDTGRFSGVSLTKVNYQSLIRFDMKTVLKWAAGILAEYVVLQLIASPFIAYAVARLFAVWQGVDAARGLVPPLFLPILSALVIAMTLNPGFVAPILKWYRTRRYAYRNEVENVYIKVSGVYKPAILNPRNPGNPDAMKELAQRDVDLLRPKLKTKRDDVPPNIDVDDNNSLRQWYEFLRDERVRINQ